MKPQLYQFSPNKFTILAIDDTQANLKVLATVLTEEGFRVLTARNGESGIQRALHGKPDLILLDVMMPTIDGFETCIRLKNDPETASIPVIFMTALDHTKHKVRGFEVGGVDYISKPFEHPELLARLKTHLTNHQLLRKLDDEVRKQTEEIQTALTREQTLRRSLAIALDKEHELNQLKSNIIATISHELRTPLNAIIGYSENMLEEAREFNNLDSLYLQDTERIFQAGGHLLQLINDILDLAKLEANQMHAKITTFSILNLLENISETIKPLMEKQGNEFLLENTSSILFIDSDELKVRQILLNLLTNAAKFTHKGTVTLTILERNDGYLCFSVEDTGIGISVENHQKIFDSFRQVQHSKSRSYEGTGLGLAISKQFAELLAGKIELDSQFGKGSIFTLSLPILNEELKVGDLFATE